jgi:hypothetical protein
MPRVPGGETLSFEHVAQVAPAPGALNLHPLSVRIGKPTDGPRDLLVERGPTTVGIELVLGPVERRTAPLALVRSGHGVALVFSRKRRLGSLVNDYSLFRSSERT